MNRHLFILIALTTLLFLFPTSAVLSQTYEENLHDLTLEDLLNVRVVSSTQEAVALSEAPSTTFVVTGDQIRRWGIRRLSELIDRFIPGAFAGEDLDDIILAFRGITSDSNLRVLLLLNGHEYNTQWNNGPSSESELGLMDDIENVEVLIGPHTALYGSSATIGVINIITKTGRNFNGVQVSANYGSGDYKKGDLLVGNTVNDSLDYFISAGGLAADGLDNNDNGPLNIFRFPPSWRFYGNVHYKQFELMSRFTRSSRAFYIQPESETTPNVWTNYDTFFVVANREFRINDNLRYLLDLTYDGIETQRHDFTLGTKLRAVGEDRYSAKLTTFYGPHKNHRFVFGAHYRRDEFGEDWSGDNFNFTTEIIDGVVTGIPADPFTKRVLTPYGRNVYGLFGQDSIKLHDHYSLLLGFRYDRIEAPQNHEPNSFSPRVALVITPDENTVFKAMFTSGASRQLNAAVTSPDAIGFGNPTIVNAQKPERLHSFELSAFHRFNPQLEFSINGFYNSLRNIFGLDPGSVPPPFVLINAGRIDYFGFEAIMNANPNSHTFLRIIHQYVQTGSVHDPFDILTTFDEEHPNNYPENITKILADYRISRKVSVNGNVNLVWNNFGSDFSHETIDTGFYALLNANFVWQMTPTTQIVLSGYNLFNERDRIPPFFQFRSFNPGRNFNVDLDFQF
ncbi:MAG TPA: TonB-dependent receptor [Acidobacteriota bacterium]|nr:TonB-dependent receptor [Acidobacteriota bacterium]